MKNYRTYEPGIFSTNQEEILALKKTDRMNLDYFKTNLEKIKKFFLPRKVIDFSIRQVPEKRSKYDTAVVLCIKTEEGEFFAKRHQNSQYLYLDY